MQTPRFQYDRIIITGASSGFGEAFAGTLAPHGPEYANPATIANFLVLSWPYARPAIAWPTATGKTGR